VGTTRRPKNIPREKSGWNIGRWKEINGPCINKWLKGGGIEKYKFNSFEGQAGGIRCPSADTKMDNVPLNTNYLGVKSNRPWRKRKERVSVVWATLPEHTEKGERGSFSKICKGDLGSVE